MSWIRRRLRQQVESVVCRSTGGGLGLVSNSFAALIAQRRPMIVGTPPYAGRSHPIFSKRRARGSWASPFPPGTSKPPVTVRDHAGRSSSIYQMIGKNCGQIRPPGWSLTRETPPMPLQWSGGATGGGHGLCHAMDFLPEAPALVAVARQVRVACSFSGRGAIRKMIGIRASLAVDRGSRCRPSCVGGRPLQNPPHAASLSIKASRADYRAKVSGASNDGA